MNTKQGLNLAWRISASQGLMLTLTSLAALFLFGYVTSGSLLMGGFVCAVPQFCFGLVLFSQVIVHAPQVIFRNACRGEALKFALAIALFIAAYSWSNLKPAAFVAGYVISQCVGWAVMARSRWFFLERV